MHDASSEAGPRPTIAVLMACHNRRDVSLHCVGRVLEQTVSRQGAVRIFVTDDGSTDGTGQALAALSHAVEVTAGSGSLFWASGMAQAEQRALPWCPDLLLWLNDDTILDSDALERLLRCHGDHPDAILVGATRDPTSGRVTYGGRVRTSRWHPQRFAHLPASTRIQKADTFNGNVVLIPAGVQRQVGLIDAAYPHGYADDDYGLRATELGIPILQIPGTVGTCARNPVEEQVRGFDAWRRSQSRKGLPWRAQAHYWRRHGGRLWVPFFLGQQVRMLLPVHRRDPGRTDVGNGAN
ncbi:MAG: glycosyltransferase family 2 protein [Candidatus Nanopelagicales bacterium]